MSTSHEFAAAHAAAIASGAQSWVCPVCNGQRDVARPRPERTPAEPPRPRRSNVPRPEPSREVRPATHRAFCGRICRGSDPAALAALTPTRTAEAQHGDDCEVCASIDRLRFRPAAGSTAPTVRMRMTPTSEEFDLPADLQAVVVRPPFSYQEHREDARFAMGTSVSLYDGVCGHADVTVRRLSELLPGRRTAVGANYTLLLVLTPLTEDGTQRGKPLWMAAEPVVRADGLLWREGDVPLEAVKRHMAASGHPDGGLWAVRYLGRAIGRLRLFPRQEGDGAAPEPGVTCKAMIVESSADPWTSDQRWSGWAWFVGRSCEFAPLDEQGRATPWCGEEDVLREAEGRPLAAVDIGRGAASSEGSLR